MSDKEYESPDSAFRLKVIEESENVRLNFFGKSKARTPAEFLDPILDETSKMALINGKGLILDFYDLEFMNSSTVAPVIKLWAQLKSEGIPLTIEFNKDILWQKANFSAFEIFKKESTLFNLHPR